MASRIGSRRASLGIAALAALMALWTLPAIVLAAPRLPATQTPTRPSQAIAYARIAVARVLTYYVGNDNNGVPIPERLPCAADGVLVGATGSGSSYTTYILLPTAAVNPLTPCPEVQAAYQQLYAPPASWSLSRVDILLNAAYTGTSPKQLGSITYSIDPAAIRTDGGPSAPRLFALPLSVPSGMPTHDLPVLSLPQPSDAPATGPTEMVDLAGSTGDLVARTALDPTTVVYPVDLPSDAILPAPKGATPTATPAVASPSAQQLSLGAPAIDSNGRLVGMIISDSNGNHVLAKKNDLAAMLQGMGKSGALMTKWQQGLAAFYAAPPQYSQAQSTLSALQSSDKDFGGVAPFLTAAKKQSGDIAPLTQPAPTPASTGNGSGGGSGGANATTITPSTLALLIGIGAAILILLLGVIVALVSRARARRAAAAAMRVPPEEIGLDLLPRASMYSGYSPPPAHDAPAGRMPAMPSGPATHIDEAPTLVGIMRAGPTGPRQATSLMPHAAGLTDPGRRRASDPNQDNIFALEGIRLANGRPQPYGFFIVADGMGGHEHGQEASAAVIETLAGVIQRGLAGAQELDERTLTGLVREGIAQAHAELRRRNAAAHADMGTTLTVALVLDDTAYIANVGDSRTYVMSPDTGLRQITTDHSIVASLAAAGVIRPEEIYTHPRRNQIYRSLGGNQDEVETDTFTTTLQAGDKLLLCSDGLWEMVRDPRIEQILRATADPRQAVELLVREANANGGEDNISAVVVRMLEEMPERPRPGVRILAAPQGAQIR